MEGLDTWEVGPYLLRPLQRELILAGREAMRMCIAKRKHPRVILVAPCGFGKTVVSSYIMQQAMAKGKRCGFIVHGRQLVYQKSDKLAESEVMHTVVMAKAKGIAQPYAAYYDGTPPKCAVISKDTYQSLVENHGIEHFDMDLWIIDECHLAGTDGWWNLIDRNGNTPVIGLSATPIKGNGLGLGDRWSEIVQ